MINGINGSLLFEAAQNNEKIIYGNNMQMLKEPEMGDSTDYILKIIRIIKNSKFSACLVKYSLWKKVVKLI